MLSSIIFVVSCFRWLDFSSEQAPTESSCQIVDEGFQSLQSSNLLLYHRSRILSLFLRILKGKKTALAALKLGYLHSWVPFHGIPSLTWSRDSARNERSARFWDLRCWKNHHLSNFQFSCPKKLKPLLHTISRLELKYLLKFHYKWKFNSILPEDLGLFTFSDFWDSEMDLRLSWLEFTSLFFFSWISKAKSVSEVSAGWFWLALSVVCVVTDRIFGFAGLLELSDCTGKESMGRKLLLGRFCLTDKFKEERRLSAALSKEVEDAVAGLSEALMSEKTGLRVGRPKRSYVPDGRSWRNRPEALSLISFSEIDLAEIIGAVDTASVLSSSEDEEPELSTSLTSGAVFLAETKFYKELTVSYLRISHPWMS